MTFLNKHTLGLTAMCLVMAGSVHAQGLKVAPGLLGPKAQAAIQQSNEPLAADHIVAVVNSEPITNHEVRSRLERLEQQAARSGAPIPSRAESTKQVLEVLILEKAQLQLATEAGIRIEKATLDEAELNVARQNQVTVARMHEQLQAQGMGLMEFRENIRRQLMLQRLREREVDARVRVSELDLDRFLSEKMDNPGADLQLNLSQVLVVVPENVEPARLASLMKRAQTVAEKARAGEDFAGLVREYSDAPDRSNGGAMGMRGADRYPDLFVLATRSVQAGGIAGPVRSPAGFHVLKVLEKKIAGLPDAVAPQTHARHILLRPTAQLPEAAALAKLAALRQQIMSGQATFEALAKEVSQDSSAAQGGDLGWVGAGVFVPEFEDVMNRLAINEISNPIASRFGAHLIQVLERRQLALTPREQREQIRQLVREQKLEEAYTKWLEDIRVRAYVEYREPPQ